ncbi:hypothetical protein [Lacrimispora amygdalina]|uniref:hypothetical protein n=1 Tax=Lacrimispora amygdalina TaxID=253257 RepID=UPI00140A40AF|nr:hypothetical protein [Lacrimispora amygdalina]
MNKYEIKFYKNDEEIEIEDIPEEYLNGIIESCRNEIASRERMERVLKKMLNNQTDI